MGWAIPAALSSSLSQRKRKTVCIVGDGSFMMNIQELQTLKHNNCEITIIVINNRGYSMIKQTQDQWLDGEYIASSEEGGVSFPVLRK